ncbi:CADD family putative folate metabolism protein [bacterium]|nr:CADD family putative folate metabolism protein [bacterium]
MYDKNEFLKKLHSQIEQKSLLKHPFYQAWTRGELTLESLQDYATQYYKHVEAFPTYLSAVHAGCDDMSVRRHLLDNLNDEEAGNPNHPELWMQFAKGLGLKEEDIKASEIRPETRNLIDTFRAVCLNESTAAGVGALYSYESQIPEVSETKIEGLKEFYGIDNPETYAYFTVHIEADKEHSRVERELLLSLVGAENHDSVISSSDQILDALNGLLDGVCERHGISCEPA